MTYVLAGLFPYAAPQQIGSTAAYRWTFFPSNTTSDVTRKTYSIESDGPDAADLYAYGQLASLQCNFSQDDARVGGNMFARLPAYNQTRTASPTVIDIRPVKRNQIDTYLDTAFGSLGSTKITDSFQTTFAVGDRWKPVWEFNGPISQATAFGKTFRRAAEQTAPVTFGFLTAHNAQSRGYLDTALDNAMRYFRVMATGSQIATNGGSPVYEQLILDVAGKIDVPDEDADQDVFSRRYSFHSLYDANLGWPYRFQVTNLLSGL
jgi:hypothetical protein